MADRAMWEKLGASLRERREDGLGYRKLAQFARERGRDGFGERVAWNLEHAARDSYSPKTLLDADRAYGLEPGSISRFLGGGELAEIPEAGLLDGLSEEDAQTVREYVAMLRDRAEQRKRASG